MKKVLLIIAGFIIVCSTAFKPGNSCESFFPQKIGSKWEMTGYDSKDKVTSMSKSELISVTDITGGLEAKVSIETMDDKGNSTNKGDVIMKCQDDKFYMDMSGMFPSGQMKGMENIEIEMTNQYMEFPSNPVAGQKLEDAESTMIMKMNGMQIMSTTIKMTNRKIEGFENVTTTAGTYNCMKYTSDQEISSKMFNSKGHSVMYMAKNVGLIKLESYNDKNELQSKMLMTSFSN